VDKKTVGKAFLFAEENLFKVLVKVGDKPVSLFDKVHRDRAKNFFIARARYQRDFSDRLKPIGA